jgi:predicted Fe-Mo cluster-binding NifX family protein/ferredoxin
MKIAVTSTGPTIDDNVEARFGRCTYFLIIDTDTMQFEAIENPNIALGGGAGIQSAQLMLEKGVTAVLTGNCGPNAFNVFGQAGIQVIVGISGTVRAAVEQLKTGKFSSADGPSVQSHFGVGSGQPLPFGSDSPAMGNPGMGRGGGMGRGMGGGRGMGRGGGRGMGMGKSAPMSGLTGGFSAGQPFNVPKGGRQELEELKQQAEILKQQKQQIEKRISELESGRKAAAFVQTDKCTGCGICADVCPANAIRIDKHAVVNPQLCTACAACVSECPNEAIIITQQKVGS